MGWSYTLLGQTHEQTQLHSNVASDASLSLRASAQMIGRAATLSETRQASVALPKDDKQWTLHTDYKIDYTAK